MNVLNEKPSGRRRPKDSNGPAAGSGMRLMVDNFGHVKHMPVSNRKKTKKRVKKGSGAGHSPTNNNGHHTPHDTSPSGRGQEVSDFERQRSEYRAGAPQGTDFMALKEEYEASKPPTRAPSAEPAMPLPRSNAKHRKDGSAGAAHHESKSSPYGTPAHLAPKYEPKVKSGSHRNGSHSADSRDTEMAYSPSDSDTHYAPDRPPRPPSSSRNKSGSPSKRHGASGRASPEKTDHHAGSGANGRIHMPAEFADTGVLHTYLARADDEIVALTSTGCQTEVDDSVAAALRGEVTELTSLLEEKAADISHLQAELASARDTIAKMKAEASKRRSNDSQQQTTPQKPLPPPSNPKASASPELKNAKAKNKQLVSENQDLKNELHLAQDENAALTTEVACLQQELSDLRRAHETELAAARLTQSHTSSSNAVPVEVGPARGGGDPFTLDTSIISDTPTRMSDFSINSRLSRRSTVTQPEVAVAEYDDEFVEDEVFGSVPEMSDDESSESFGSADFDAQFDEYNDFEEQVSLSSISDNEDSAESNKTLADQLLVVSAPSRAILSNFNKTTGLHGRDSVCANLATLALVDGKGVVVTGPSGSGKTAILVRLVSELERKPGLVVVPHFCGHLSKSTTVRGLLLSLCAHLASLVEDSPDDVDDLLSHLEDQNLFALRESLKGMMATLVDHDPNVKRLVLVVDNVEALQHGWQPVENASALVWLPPDLPPYVSVICTADPNAHAVSSLLARGWEEVAIEPIDGSACSAMLDAIHQSSPPPWLQDLKAKCADGCWPEQVRLASAIMSMSQPGQKMDVPSPVPGCAELTNIIFKALEARLGASVATTALLALAEARAPLYDHELSGVIKCGVGEPISPSALNAVISTITPLLLPSTVVSGLHLSSMGTRKRILDRYVTDLPPKTGVAHLDSPYFRWTRSRILQTLNGHFVKYFSRTVDPLENLSYLSEDDRSLREYVHHQLKAGPSAIKPLSQSLGSVAFVTARLRRGQAYELLDDFSMVEQVAALYDGLASVQGDTSVRSVRPPNPSKPNAETESKSDAKKKKKPTGAQAPPAEQSTIIGGSVAQPGLLISSARIRHHFDILSRHFLALSMGLRNFSDFLNEQTHHARSRKCLTYPRHHQKHEKVYCMAQSLSAPLLVASGAGPRDGDMTARGSLHVWSSDTGKKIVEFPLRAPPLALTFALHRDDMLILVGGSNWISVFDLGLGKSVGEHVFTEGAADENVSVHVSTCPIPEYWSLVAGTPQPPAPCGDGVARLALVARNNRLYVLSLDQLERSDTSQGQRVLKPQQAFELMETAERLAFCQWTPVASRGKTPVGASRPTSTSGTIIAVSESGTAVFWELRPSERGGTAIALIQSGSYKLSPLADGMNCVTITPDGTLLAVLHTQRLDDEDEKTTKPVLTVLDWISMREVVAAQTLTGPNGSPLSPTQTPCGPLSFTSNQGAVSCVLADSEKEGQDSLVLYSLHKVPQYRYAFGTGSCQLSVSCPVLPWANSTVPSSSSEIVTASESGELIVWDTSRSRRRVPILKQDIPDIVQVVLAHGDLCATVSQGGTLGLWDIHSVSQVGVLDSDDGSPGSQVVVSPNGTLAVTFSGSAPLQLWSLIDGSGLYHVWPKRSVAHVRWLDDDTLIYSVNDEEDGAHVEVWRVEKKPEDSTWTLVMLKELPSVGVEEQFTCLEVNQSTRRVFLGTIGGKVYSLSSDAWDLECFADAIGSPVSALTLAALGTLLVVGTSKGGIAVFRLNTKEIVYADIPYTSSSVERLVNAGYWGCFVLLNTGRVLSLKLAELGLPGHLPYDNNFELEIALHDSAAPITSLTSRGHGKVVVTGKADGSLVFWQQKSEHEIVYHKIGEQLGHEASPITALVFDDQLWNTNPATYLLITCARDGSVRMWPTELKM